MGEKLVDASDTTLSYDHNLTTLQNILKELDIPAFRGDVDKPSNLVWLNRNLTINYHDHPRIQEARKLVRYFLEKRWMKMVGKRPLR
jgi:hypothetical protein